MPTVLLVDDSATDRSLMGGLLEKSGIRVRFAENGSGALKQLRGEPPDVVLTDMQMPEMDGLELVRAIRTSYPRIPVILMTGHGSETLAAQALQEGAASYVPKSQAKELLVDCIHSVIETAHSDSDFDRLIDHAVVADFHFELVNDVTLIPPMVTLVQQMMAGLDLCDATGRLQVGIALEEALKNAIYHGNLELTSEQVAEPIEMLRGIVQQRCGTDPYGQRKCFVRCTIAREEARFTIRDEGPGFDVKGSLNVSVNEEASRGLVLMWGLMDKVVFNRTGNEVTLVKRKQQPSKQIPVHMGNEEKSESHQVQTGGKPEKLGELISVDGGPSIALSQRRISIGRHPTCDVVLGHTDVSQQHCLLYMYSGWWYVKDLKSANGIRINRLPVDQRRISPGSILSIGTHRFEVRYNPSDLGAVGITPPVDPF